MLSQSSRYKRRRLPSWVHSVSFSWTLHSGGNQLPCHEQPYEKGPLGQELKLSSGSHVSELERGSSIPSQAFRGACPHLTASGDLMRGPESEPPIEATL